MDESHTQIAELETDITSMQAQWQQVYQDTDVSSSELQEQVNTADESIRQFHEASSGLHGGVEQ